MPDPPGPNSYPIITFSWILFYKNYKDSEKAKQVSDLFQWCLLEGQNYASKLNYLPLPPNVTTKALAALSSFPSAK